MDNMLEHPGIELQLLIKEKGLTQKAFASILGKKISEVNELLKGKRNITIQRDYLLHQTLGTPVKYWILKQIDYDYSLLDTDNISLPVRGAADSEGNEEEAEGLSQSNSHSEPEARPAELDEDLRGKAEELNTQDFYSVNGASSLHSSEGQKENKDDKDLKNRAQIFRNF